MFFPRILSAEVMEASLPPCTARGSMYYPLCSVRLCIPAAVHGRRLLFILLLLPRRCIHWLRPSAGWMFGFTEIIYLYALPIFLSRQPSEYLSLSASHYDNLTLLYSFLPSLCRLNVWLYLNYLPLQISPFLNLTVF